MEGRPFPQVIREPRYRLFYWRGAEKRYITNEEFTLAEALYFQGEFTIGDIFPELEIVQR